MEKYVVDDIYNYSEFSIEKSLFYEDPEVIEYINSISSYEKLKEEDIMQLLLNKTDKSIRDKFIKSYLYLPVLIASKMTAITSSLSNMDLIEYGNMGLIKGVETYKIDDGNLEKYLIKKIYKSIILACQKEGKMFNLSLNEGNDIIDINKLHEDKKMETGQDLSELYLFYEWDASKDNSFIYAHTEKFKKQKFDMYTSVRHNIVSLDAMDIEDTLGEDQSIDFEKSSIISIIHDILENAFSSGELSKFEIYILKSYFGFIKEKATGEVANDLGISVMEVQKYRRNALNKIRKLTAKELVTYTDKFIKKYNK